MDDKIQREPDPVLLIHGGSRNGDGILLIEHLHRADVDEAIGRMSLGPGEYAVIRGEVLIDQSFGVLHKTQIRNEQSYTGVTRWLHEAEIRKAAGHKLWSSDRGNTFGFQDGEDGTRHCIVMWRVEDEIPHKPYLKWLASPEGRQAHFGRKDGEEQ